MPEFLLAIEWPGRLVQWAATVGFVVLGVGIACCLLRVARGPSLADRAVAADAIGVQLIGLVVLLTLRTGSMQFVDGILILSLLSFAGAVAMAQFIARPHMPLDEEAEPLPDAEDRR